LQDSKVHMASFLLRTFAVKAVPPNDALQRAAGRIKCQAAGGLAQSAPERCRARVLKGHLAVAELCS